VWPLFALRLSTPRLELRVVRDEDLPGLVDAVLAGVQDARRAPGIPWPHLDPDEVRTAFAGYHWRSRSEVQPNTWMVQFVVRLDGVPIGVQELCARSLPVLRTVSSSSWLTRSAQGRGYGTEMRAAMLMFAFDHLGALWAESSAPAWNAPSRAVSRKLGYVENGVVRAQPHPGEAVDEIRVRLHVDDFKRPAWDLGIEGAEQALPALVQLLPGLR
jgi:RimJ/RimL family protein N-acetyltransferase